MLNPRIASALFNPSRVALIGASSDPRKNSARPLRYLLRHGFEGDILPINPGSESIDGVACYPSIGAAPGDVDLAMLMCRTEDVAPAIEACAEAGVRVAVILSGGFGETGIHGEGLQRELLAKVAPTGMRILGPNSLGMINTHGVALSANAVLEMDRLPQGRLSVVSQSGSIIGALISQGSGRGVGFSKLVSIGNEIDLSVGEIGSALVDDPDTDAILLFLEVIRSREELEAFARYAHKIGKPVIAYKLGRSPIGRELATSHTGALSGSDESARALMKALGIACVTNFEALLEAPPLFLARAPKNGRRVAVVTTTGGGAAMVVDCLGVNGFELACPPESTRDILREAGIVQQGNLVDLTLAGARPELVEAVLSDIMMGPDIDAVVMVVGSSAQFHPDLTVKPLIGFSDSPKPFAVYIVPDAGEARRFLARAGVACFRTPESCADGIRAILNWHAPKPLLQTSSAAATLLGDLATADPLLNEIEAQRVLSTVGLAFPHSVHACDSQAAATASSDVGFPLVVKVVSRDIPHKSDCQGVRLNVSSSAECAKAAEAVLAGARSHHPDARIDGILVQPMETGLTEVMVGFRRDAQSGPIVVLADGGILAEIYSDVSIRAAPVERDEALAMISEIKALSLARGYRGAALGDLDALAEVVVAVSRLAELPQVTEAEVNPVLVKPEGQGVALLDALVALDTDTSDNRNNNNEAQLSG